MMFGGQPGFAHQVPPTQNQPLPPPPQAASSDPQNQQLNQRLWQLVACLSIPQHRETALYELSKQRESFPDLAPTLWYSTGVLSVLLQEIVAVYPMLSPPTLSVSSSNRVCNAMALLQVVAADSDTRSALLAAHIPLFLYPFLNTASSDRPFEYLRLTALGVIGALVKAEDEDVIQFLLSTEIVPLCLKIMEKGSELSKTVATFVVQKILIYNIGLQYICATPERFMAVSSVLRQMTADRPSARLLRHIVRCYLRLTDHERARNALVKCLPDQLRDTTFSDIVDEDPNVRKWLYQLLLNVGDPTALQQHQQQQSATPTTSQ